MNFGEFFHVHYWKHVDSLVESRFRFGVCRRCRCGRFRLDVGLRDPVEVVGRVPDRYRGDDAGFAAWLRDLMDLPGRRNGGGTTAPSTDAECVR